MTPEERAKVIRKQIEAIPYVPCPYTDPHDGTYESKCETVIADALAEASRPPPGHIRDDHWVDHKWPVTADGAPVMVGDEVWYQVDDSAMYVGGMICGKPIEVNCWTAGNMIDGARVSECYLSREAAEAARNNP